MWPMTHLPLVSGGLYPTRSAESGYHDSGSSWCVAGDESKVILVALTNTQHSAEGYKGGKGAPLATTTAVDQHGAYDLCPDAVHRRDSRGKLKVEKRKASGGTAYAANTQALH